VRRKTVTAADKPNQALQPTAGRSVHHYEVRPRKDHRGVDLISDVLPFGRRRFAPSADKTAYKKPSTPGARCD